MNKAPSQAAQFFQTKPPFDPIALSERIWETLGAAFAGMEYPHKREPEIESQTPTQAVAAIAQEIEGMARFLKETAEAEDRNGYSADPRAANGTSEIPGAVHFIEEMARILSQLTDEMVRFGVLPS